MSFKVKRFFSLLIHFILGSFSLIIGGFSLFLPWSLFLQTKVMQFIQDDTLILSLFGLGFILIGISLLIYLGLGTQRRYTTIRLGERAVTVDKTLLEQYMETYWQEHFPKFYVPSQLTIKKNSIQIVADLPYMAKEDQAPFLERVKQDLDDIFRRLLGYSHDVHLIASFDPRQPST